MIKQSGIVKLFHKLKKIKQVKTRRDVVTRPVEVMHAALGATGLCVGCVWCWWGVCAVCSAALDGGTR